jgi:hypothetical protein
MSNIIRFKFADGPAEKLIQEIRAVIYKPCYNDLRVCELIGVLEMLKIEMDAENK